MPKKPKWMVAIERSLQEKLDALDAEIARSHKLLAENEAIRKEGHRAPRIN